MHEETKHLVSEILELLTKHGLRMFTGEDNFGEVDFSTSERISILREARFRFYDYQQKHQNCWNEYITVDNGEKLKA
jgi:hypothetical protein